MHKSTRACISSRFDRYNIFFELWFKNCLNYNFDIVIFLDGKVQTIIDRIAELNIQTHKVSVIEVQQYGNIYKIDNLKFFKNIFDVVYFDMGYDAIIYTDPDELLLVNDFNLFLNCSDNVLVSKGFEMVQHKNENEYSLNKKFLDQRNYGFWSEQSYNPSHAFYNKMCVFKKHNYPTNVGRHASHHSFKPTQIENEFIFLIHLREICKKTTIHNAKENIAKYQKNHNQHSFYSEKDLDHWLDAWFYPYSVEIPFEIKNLITKHDL